MISLMNRSPFEPLAIHLSDGDVLKVEHPYQIAVAPSQPTCIVYDDDGTTRWVAYRNMTQVVAATSNGNGA